MKFISCNSDPQIFSLKVDVSAKLSQECGIMHSHCASTVAPSPLPSLCPPRLSPGFYFTCPGLWCLQSQAGTTTPEQTLLQTGTPHAGERLQYTLKTYRDKSSSPKFPFFLWWIPGLITFSSFSSVCSTTLLVSISAFPESSPASGRTFRSCYKVNVILS